MPFWPNIHPFNDDSAFQTTMSRLQDAHFEHLLVKTDMLLTKLVSNHSSPCTRYKARFNYYEGTYAFVTSRATKDTMKNVKFRHCFMIYKNLVFNLTEMEH